MLTIDTTAKTNNENRPLLTINGKDRFGNVFTVLRAFLPNEQGWMFRWIFSDILPTMFGDTMKEVNLFISDGDVNEYLQIDNAIVMYYPKCHQARCGWHIVDRGWKNHMYGPMIFLDKNNQELMTKMTKVIKNWLFSFMKDSCETEEEYKASKYLLMKLVKSQYVKDNLGTFFTANFLSFFRKHVEVYEHSMFSGDVKTFGIMENLLIPLMKEPTIE